MQARGGSDVGRHGAARLVVGDFPGARLRAGQSQVLLQVSSYQKLKKRCYSKSISCNLVVKKKVISGDNRWFGVISIVIVTQIYPLFPAFRIKLGFARIFYAHRQATLFKNCSGGAVLQAKGMFHHWPLCCHSYLRVSLGVLVLLASATWK